MSSYETPCVSCDHKECCHSAYSGVFDCNWFSEFKTEVTTLKKSYSDLEKEAKIFALHLGKDWIDIPREVAVLAAARIKGSQDE